MERGEPIGEPSEILPDGSRVVDGEVLPEAYFRDDLDGDEPEESAEEFDPDGALFEVEGTEVEAPAEEHFIHDAAAVAVRAMDHLPDKRYPLPIKDVIARRQAKAARRAASGADDDDEPRSAYDDLGGRAPDYDAVLDQDEILDNVINEYEPWHVDIREAVERFGVVEFSRKELASMDDFETYSLHFYNFMETIYASMRQIKATLGDVTLDPYLNDRYHGRTIEEMNNYYGTLEWLVKDLVRTGIPRVICGALEEDYGKLEWSDGKKNPDAVRSNRLKAIAGYTKYRKDHRQYPHVQVVSVKGKPHLDHIE